jgi:hypothetical protein
MASPLEPTEKDGPANIWGFGHLRIIWVVLSH